MDVKAVIDGDVIGQRSFVDEELNDIEEWVFNVINQNGFITPDLVRITIEIKSVDDDDEDDQERGR